jgi:hypothetical protein
MDSSQQQPMFWHSLTFVAALLSTVQETTQTAAVKAKGCEVAHRIGSAVGGPKAGGIRNKGPKEKHGLRSNKNIKIAHHAQKHSTCVEKCCRVKRGGRAFL